MRWKSLGPVAALVVLFAWDTAFEGLDLVGRRSPAATPSPPRREGPASAALPTPLPGAWVTDMGEEGAGLLGLRVPPAPFAGQKRPPCARTREREVNGGCWVATEHKPPCPEATYESAGRCLLPVLAAKRLPVSGSSTPW